MPASYLGVVREIDDEDLELQEGALDEHDVP